MLTLPLTFLDSWQYTKLVKLHGQRLADACALTLWQMYAYLQEHGTASPIPELKAMALAKAYGRRDKRRILAAMTQCNVLRLLPDGYRVRAVLAVVPAQRKVVLEPLSKTPKQLALPLSTARKRPKVQQKQGGAHRQPPARAGAMSATLPEKAPLIDPASTHTDFLQATLSERSDASPPGARAPGVLSLMSEAKKAAANLPNGCMSAGSASTDTASLPKAASGASKARLTLLQGTVDRAIEPPSRFEDVRDVPQRVNTQRVIKQQKRVSCRQPSSTAVNLLQEPQMPSLSPTAVEIAMEAARVWPSQPFPMGLARWIVEQQFTWDEIRSALEHMDRAQGRERPPGPNVLKNQLMEMRARKADGADRKPPCHASAKNGQQCLDRAALRDAINAYLGPNREEHYAFTASYLDAMQGRPLERIVSLYTEMIGEVEAAFRWERVSEALAGGRDARRAGILPPLQDGSAASKCFQRFLGDVQSLVDKSKLAS